MLKNSNFCLDHSSEDRWQPRWKIPWGFGGVTGFAACDPPTWLAVTTTSLDDAMRAGTRFWQLLNLRVFQHRVMGGSSSVKADTMGQDMEEETRYGLFRWPRYLDGRDACLRSRPRRRGGSREQVGVDGRGDH